MNLGQLASNILGSVQKKMFGYPAMYHRNNTMFSMIVSSENIVYRTVSDSETSISLDRSCFSVDSDIFDIGGTFMPPKIGEYFIIQKPHGNERYKITNNEFGKCWEWQFGDHARNRIILFCERKYD